MRWKCVCVEVYMNVYALLIVIKSMFEFRFENEFLFTGRLIFLAKSLECWLSKLIPEVGRRHFSTSNQKNLENMCFIFVLLIRSILLRLNLSQ